MADKIGTAFGIALLGLCAVLVLNGIWGLVSDPIWTWSEIVRLWSYAPALWIFIAVAGLYSLYLKLTGQKPPRGDAP